MPPVFQYQPFGYQDYCSYPFGMFGLESPLRRSDNGSSTWRPFAQNPCYCSQGCYQYWSKPDYEEIEMPRRQNRQNSEYRYRRANEVEVPKKGPSQVVVREEHPSNKVTTSSRRCQPIESRHGHSSKETEMPSPMKLGNGISKSSESPSQSKKSSKNTISDNVQNQTSKAWEQRDEIKSKEKSRNQMVVEIPIEIVQESDPKVLESNDLKDESPVYDGRSLRLQELEKLAEETRHLETQLAETSNCDGSKSKNAKEHLYMEETLTRLLFRLDAVESGGDEEIKRARKACILRVEDCLQSLDEMKSSPASCTESESGNSNLVASEKEQDKEQILSDETTMETGRTIGDTPTMEIANRDSGKILADGNGPANSDSESCDESANEHDVLCETYDNVKMNASLRIL